jgi:hypothetical protein
VKLTISGITKINKYRPFAYVFFFINSYGLPHGLLFTGILTPFFYLWLVFNRKKNLLLKYALFLAPFATFHFINGVNLYYYAVSTALLFTAYIFTYAFKTFVEEKSYLEDLFLKFTKINFVLTLIAIVLFFTPYWDLVWIRNSVSDKLHNFPRLAMFTYEPSYYSTLLVPIFLYYFATFLEHPERKYAKLLLMLSVSLILSFALGILSAILFAVVVSILLKFKHFLKKRAFVNSFLLLSTLTVLTLVFLALFFPDNPLFIRIDNIMDGRDTSGKGRTVEAFVLAYKIAEQKSLAWGAGLGQIKEVGDEIIRSHYNYDRNEIPVVTIPCAAAETLAIFGFVGLFVRILVQLFLYFKTRVYRSSFRTMLFMYMFIYQFTGSYITNIAEYVIWVLAFIPYFYQFEKSPGVKLQANN